MTDWNLVSDGLLTIEWIFETDKKENTTKTLRELWAEKFKDKYPDESRKPLNKAFLLMSASLLFVYIKEREVKINYKKISIEKFKIIEQENDNTLSKKLCRRIRNSIAHGKFYFENEDLVMEDWRMKKENSFIKVLRKLHVISPLQKKDYIKFSIHIVDFGKFIHAFAYEVNRQKIEQQNR